MWSSLLRVILCLGHLAGYVYEMRMDFALVYEAVHLYSSAINKEPQFQRIAFSKRDVFTRMRVQSAKSLLASAKTTLKGFPWLSSSPFAMHSDRIPR